MPFTRTTFLGASVRNFQSTIGWNGATSSLTVSLVEDPDNGDSFSPVEPGQPIYFEMGGFEFYGILNKYEQTNNQSGYPTYTVNCTDPTPLLEKVQVIIGGYYGQTYALKNLINVFGYYENASFGSSLANETGMPW